MECSQIVRRQSNNCPICRTKVSTFIQIKDENAPNPESNEPKSLMRKATVKVVDNKKNDESEEEEESEEEVEESKNAHRVDEPDLEA
mmetsp:Transcript_128/g.126  ORF Transcript_128/g.126 Transcript_128/m.126 type:complete len:87 (-) Transcript_128:24-284(-)